MNSNFLKFVREYMVLLVRVKSDCLTFDSIFLVFSNKCVGSSSNQFMVYCKVYIDNVSSAPYRLLIRNSNKAVKDSTWFKLKCFLSCNRNLKCKIPFLVLVLCEKPRSMELRQGMVLIEVKMTAHFKIFIVFTQKCVYINQRHL